jgi:hypothetical protein
LNEIIETRKTGDSERAIRTGLCVVRKRAVGSGPKQQIIEEYEVDTALLAAMADLEKQVAGRRR